MISLWEGPGASISISPVEGLVVERRPLILKIALSFPGPIPPRNLKVGAGELEVGMEM